MSMKVKDLLTVAKARFLEERCLDPQLDAELLFLYMMKKDRSYIVSHYSDVLEDKICDEYFRLVDLRASGMPVQYIIGTQDFMGRTFLVNPDVLIPRQDTELLVETALDWIKNKKSPLGGIRVLDLCTGSGAIAISLAAHAEESKIKVTAADISPKALDVARQNAASNAVSKTVTFMEGDLFSPFPLSKKGKGKKQFDLIVANPPYIPRRTLPTLMREVRDHEPMLALDGGEDGMDFYIRILNEAHPHMKEDGRLLLEIGHDQGEVMIALSEAAGAYEPAEIRKDLAGRDRLAVLRKKPGIPLEKNKKPLAKG